MKQLQLKSVFSARFTDNLKRNLKRQFFFLKSRKMANVSTHGHKKRGFDSPSLFLSATVITSGVESVLLTDLFPAKRICTAKIQHFF